jgi:hypothetical protein
MQHDDNDAITLDDVHRALNLVVYERPGYVEPPEPPCDWNRLCGEERCRFPRYFRGEPTGLVAFLLLQLGYPQSLLKELECEYEMGEVIHPSVKITNSRNPAVARIEDKALALLGWIQERQKCGMTWNEIQVAAFTPYRFFGGLDRKRRPWLY